MITSTIIRRPRRYHDRHSAMNMSSTTTTGSRWGRTVATSFTMFAVAGFTPPNSLQTTPDLKSYHQTAATTQRLISPPNGTQIFASTGHVSPEPGPANFESSRCSSYAPGPPGRHCNPTQPLTAGRCQSWQIWFFHVCFSAAGIALCSSPRDDDLR